MKHIILAILILALSAPEVFALRPKTNYQDEYLEVTDVERQDTCLRVYVILKNLPGYWVIVSKNNYLQPHNDPSKKYKLIGAENIELDKRIWMKESGQHDAVLIFDKVPSDVKVVDMKSIADNGKIETPIFGLHLEEKETFTLPAMIDPKSLFSDTPTDDWKDFDPMRYKDIPYYQENGKAHIKGKLHDYHPVAGFTTLNVYTNNQITGSRGKQTENLNPDGTFEFDLNIDYPQYSLFKIGDQVAKDVFVIPGDTVEIVTTTETDFLNYTTGFRKYFGFTGTLNDATAVNLLTDSLKSRFHLEGLISQYYHAITDKVPESANAKLEEIRTTVRKAISGLPNFLGSISVSPYVKDILANEAVSNIIFIGESMGDLERFIYSNPLAISNGNHISHNLGTTAQFHDNSTPEIENSFLRQLQKVNALLESIEVSTLHNRESLEKTKQDVAELATQVTYPAFNQALLSAYTELAVDVVLEQHGLKKAAVYTQLDIDKNADILEELIKPYKGNLIYIDFWALWCAPCRQSIIDQKKIIEHFAGQPFKVLYVSDDTNIVGSNQWLEKKGIPGEHIYISKENWKRIFEYFNLDYVPFGVLIGKDGSLLKTHFNLDSSTAEKEIERHLNY